MLAKAQKKFVSSYFTTGFAHQSYHTKQLNFWRNKQLNQRFNHSLNFIERSNQTILFQNPVLDISKRYKSRKIDESGQETKVSSSIFNERNDTLEISNHLNQEIQIPNNDIIHMEQNLVFPCYRIQKQDPNVLQFELLERKFLKNELKLKTRDIQILVSNLNYPTILPRNSCILVDINSVQCVIMPDQVYILDKESQPIQIFPDFVYETTNGKNIADFISRELSLTDNEQPFELTALESALRLVLTDAEILFKKYQINLEKILYDPALAPSEERLHDMLLIKQSLNRFITQLHELHQCLESLLGTDEDMAQMYLTDNKKGKIRNPNDHEEVELLLEAYYSQTEEIMNRVKELVHDIQSTQDYLNVCLDSQRNRMIRLELKLIMATFALTIGTLIAGLFGMNLTTGLENSPDAFMWVVLGILAGCAFTLSSFYIAAYKKGLFESIVYFLKIRKKRISSKR